MHHTEVLDFWFKEPKKWFNGGKEFDQIITEKFLEIYEIAINGDLDTWTKEAESCLALIIILDQFSRNMFRGNSRTFEYDFKALYLSKYAIKKGFLDIYRGAQKTFCIMPLMHSESLPDQEYCIFLFQELARSDDMYLKNIEYAIAHRDIVARFGRFPHRNDILSRKSTIDENLFLETHTGF